ncbi:nucleotidyltransferase family protein [Solimonas sp. SE-A11]|uniref:nucleotidyltransferase family protein n=1 Tax=Solimonas sp. SE-A11 TaxID=3054954 RepID=UPI00259CB82C|nr:nucleotidyltransferase family protein [Solimonas sp. SE-A11]MDM4772581.1 nucleotidyltransferase family protein [Solimonas sp. SE-A11]
MTIPVDTRYIGDVELDRARRLLALLLRARWTGEPISESDTSNVKAAAFSALLRIHGVASVLALRHSDQIHQLPPQLADHVVQAQRRGVNAALMQARACINVTQALERAAIPCLPLKGQALSWRLYGAIGARHSSDVDLLIDPDTVLPAVAFLLDLGYFPSAPLPQNPLHWRELMRTRHHANFRNESGTYLELHWRTEPLRSTSLPSLAQLLPETGIIASGPFRGLRELPPELLHRSLACHAARSRCARWKWGYDLLEIFGAQGDSPWNPRLIAAQPPQIRQVLKVMGAQLQVPGWQRSPSEDLICRAAAVEGRELLRGGAGIGRTFRDGLLLHLAAWAALQSGAARLEYLGWMLTRISSDVGDDAYSLVAKWPWLAPLVRVVAAIRRKTRRNR